MLEDVVIRNTWNRNSFPDIPEEAEKIVLDVPDDQDENNDDANKGLQYPMREIAKFVIPLFENDPSIKLTEEQSKALHKISICKTEECGYNASYCPNCKKITIHTSSCNNRNCPNCQSLDADAWIENKAAETIEGISYFHGVGTTPSELIPLYNANRRELYGLHMRTCAAAVVQLSRDQKHGGFTPAILSTFHPNGSEMLDHPHVHMVISGGGLTRFNTFAEASHKSFFLPQEVVASVFKGMFMNELKKTYAKNELMFPSPELFIPYLGRPVDLNDPIEWLNYVSHLYNDSWKFYIKETFNEHGNAIRYLGRYVYRTAISNSRIVSTELISTDEHPEGWVVFKYKDYRNGGKWEEKGLSARDFILRFLRHVMPKGFCRVRSFGILANSIKKKSLMRIAELRSTVYLISCVHGKSKAQIIAILYGRDVCSCSECGHKLFQINRLLPGEVIRLPKMAC